MPPPPPCGGFTDDFDQGPDLTWTTMGMAQFTNDVASAPPPNGGFQHIEDTTLVLNNCSIQIDIVTDTDQAWFFGWSSFVSGLLWLQRDQQKQLHVLATGSTPDDVVIATNVTTIRVRVSHSNAEYRVETAALGTDTWTVHRTIPEAAAPAWLAQPGYAWFGAQGPGNGSSAEFDDYNIQ